MTRCRPAVMELEAAPGGQLDGEGERVVRRCLGAVAEELADGR
jgi:hypothetical protein